MIAETCWGAFAPDRAAYAGDHPPPGSTPLARGPSPQIARGVQCPRVETASAAVRSPPTARVATVTAWRRPRNGAARSGSYGRSEAPARPSTTAAPAVTRRSLRGCRMSWPGRNTAMSTTAGTGTKRAGTHGTAGAHGSSGPEMRPGTEVPGVLRRYTSRCSWTTKAAARATAATPVTIHSGVQPSGPEWSARNGMPYRVARELGTE